ncbi:hypothetical protein L1987_73902 [Smallanthus sonchifolius]|uniref:Uncharacterized protein n=1 Tax=Smallanthus sonchifolius TaxID=185202 RepID=A0ACB9A1G0_9ASTR|nr:hypothetical protein L1987_73902 [Smallanthus sonchifolius]
MRRSMESGILKLIEHLNCCFSGNFICGKGFRCDWEALSHLFLNIDFNVILVVGLLMNNLFIYQMIDVVCHESMPINKLCTAFVNQLRTLDVAKTTVKEKGFLYNEADASMPQLTSQQMKK